MNMELEGEGRQVNRGQNYPANVPIDEDIGYREETLAIMAKFRDEIKPFRPREYSKENIKAKKIKFQWLVDELSKVYKIRPVRVIIGSITEESYKTPLSSGNSCYKPNGYVIVINGKMSVITLLHEYGHSRGFDEQDATKWSVNLFKRTFPKSYGRLTQDKHCLFIPIQQRADAV